MDHKWLLDYPHKNPYPYPKISFDSSTPSKHGHFYIDFLELFKVTRRETINSSSFHPMVRLRSNMEKRAIFKFVFSNCNSHFTCRIYEMATKTGAVIPIKIKQKQVKNFEINEFNKSTELVPLLIENGHRNG